MRTPATSRRPNVARAAMSSRRASLREGTTIRTATPRAAAWVSARMTPRSGTKYGLAT